MSWSNPWFLRSFAAISIIVGFIFLFWGTILPYGIFEIPSADPSPSSPSISLVLFADQQDEMIYPIKMIEIGWSGIWVAWHYVVFGLLFGVVIGWPLSELAGRQSAIKEASEKVRTKNQRVKMDLILKEFRAERMIGDANAFKIESQKLKGEVKRMQGEIFVMRQSAKGQIQDNEELLRNAISAEKELVKAKAKIRRLTGKSNHRAENPIDGGRKPEYL
jgi:hypothetical protein